MPGSASESLKAYFYPMHRLSYLVFILWVYSGGMAAQLPPLNSYAIDDQVPLVAEVVSVNLDLPWDLVWGPDDRIWFTERTGALKRYDPETGTTEVLDTVPGVYTSFDNSGLHALMLHPEFPTQPWLYVTYTYNEDRMRLSRFRYLNNLGLHDEEILLDMPGRESHNGSRLLTDLSGRLLYATGDAFNPALPQDSASLNGKLLRLELDGSIPDDNPFADSYLYTLGHRNMQGLVQLPSGLIWSTEHGDDTDDELNLLMPGRNYGWPFVRGRCETPEELDFCEAYDVVEPHLTWTPTSAPSGLDYYNHPAIPQWKNCLIAGFLKRVGNPGQRIQVIRLHNNGREVLDVRDYLHEGPIVATDLGQLNQVGVFGRIRDVLVAPDGSVYLCTSNREYNGRYVENEDDDRIIRIYNPAWNPIPCEDGCLSIYPSPVKSGRILYFKFDDETEGVSRISLFDAGGRRVLDAQVQASPFVELPIPQLAAGIYFIEVVYPDGREIRTRRILVLP